MLTMRPRSGCDGVWTISRVGDIEGFDRLRDVWGRLVAAGGTENVFLEQAWLARWWRAYGAGQELWTLAASDGGAGDVGAILPMALERGRGGVRRLTFMGAGEVAPNHLDLLATPEARSDTALAGAVCGYLLRNRG